MNPVVKYINTIAQKVATCKTGTFYQKKVNASYEWTFCVAGQSPSNETWLPAFTHSEYVKFSSDDSNNYDIYFRSNKDGQIVVMI